MLSLLKSCVFKALPTLYFFAVALFVERWSKGREFETHQRYCVVSLSKTLYPLLSTGSTQEDKTASQYASLTENMLTRT